MAEKRWRRAGERESHRGLLLALVLGCLTLVTLDHHGGLDPARTVAGSFFGPIEHVTSAATRPLEAVPDFFRSRDSLQHEVVSLQADNARLKQQVASSAYDRNRLAEYDALTKTASRIGYAMVPARVIAFGPAQSFSRTVTIDAGATSGVTVDETVVSNDGLVGRVIRTTPTTATVVLVVDSSSTVGARVGTSMQVGFLHGRGDIGSQARLDLDLVDRSAIASVGDTVVTWGSNGRGPYVSGIPVGTVTQVFTSLRDSSQHAVIQPSVDFSALDLVGVVVPSGTRGDRAVIEADGTLR